MAVRSESFMGRQTWVMDNAYSLAQKFHLPLAKMHMRAALTLALIGNPVPQPEMILRSVLLYQSPVGVRCGIMQASGGDVCIA